MEHEEIRLRILESAMKYIAGSGSEGVIEICRKFESYIFADKVSDNEAPKDGGIDHRQRRRNKT